jgi:hypothetical protein
MVGRNVRWIPRFQWATDGRGGVVGFTRAFNGCKFIRPGAWPLVISIEHFPVNALSDTSFIPFLSRAIYKRRRRILLDDGKLEACLNYEHTIIDNELRGKSSLRE